MNRSHTIGEKSKFAIHCRPCPENYNYSKMNKMAICHLIIGNCLIGRMTEACHLPTWLYNLTDRRNRILDTKHLLFPNEFNNLTDREIFEITLKANQLEEEFDKDFLYLPQIDNNIWGLHSFFIDETIDAYTIFFYVKEGQITFLIEDFPEHIDNKNRTYKFHFHSVEFDYFIEVINQTTAYLVTQYPDLKKCISSRNFRNR